METGVNNEQHRKPEVDETNNQIKERSCRICLMVERGDEPTQLITPCKCKGSAAYVHSSCLSRWLEESCTDSCDICRFKYLLLKKPKSAFEWIKEETDHLIDIIMAAFLVLFLSYILFMAVVLCYSTVGVVNPWITLIISITTLFWVLLIIMGLISFTIREVIAFQEWKGTHFHIQVLENANHDQTDDPNKSSQSTQNGNKITIKLNDQINNNP